MNDDDLKFSELREEGRTYLTSVFTHGSINLERKLPSRSITGSGSKAKNGLGREGHLHAFFERTRWVENYSGNARKNRCRNDRGRVLGSGSDRLARTSQAMAVSAGSLQSGLRGVQPV
ncbi:hypothetical protein E0H93_28595 [Rhizobium leguminosarum bv. viciae]|nr:hypothetical protein E0H55_27320 [Rhizobium leguminosarum bv. viciae]TCA99430.1 hypothetical protein E0H93_28595 [Rhizobium leguminosarum bv. viciae]